MYFRYGGYTHDAGEVTLSSINRTTEFSARGQPKISKVTWNIQGILQADTNALLTAALRRLEAAYARQGGDAGLYNDDGSATAHILTSGNAIGGVRSLGISYPKGDSIEYVLQRTYSVTLEADYPFTSTGVIEFSETLSFTGTCGPRFIYLPVINGMPEKQIVQQKTTQRASQSGSAMGFSARPVPPAPLWPKDEHEEQRTIGLTAPKWLNGREIDYGVSWSYSFESASPLNGVPRSN